MIAPMERRTVLSVGGTAVLALATGSASLPDADADGPVAVVEEYYRRASATDDSDAFADDVRALSHGASPLVDLANDVPMAFDDTLRQELIEAEVVAEDLSAERLRVVSDFFTGSVTDEQIETLAAENAVVSATVADADAPDGELVFEWFVAPEDGAWRLVWPGDWTGPEAVVREFYRRANAAESAAAFATDVRDLSHSLSPLSDVAADVPGFFDGAQRRELAEVEIAAEDVDAERVREISDFLAGALTRVQLETIADENALAAATILDDRVESGQLVREWLVAPEDGRWRLVWF